MLAPDEPPGAELPPLPEAPEFPFLPAFPSAPALPDDPLFALPSDPLAPLALAPFGSFFPPLVTASRPGPFPPLPFDPEEPRPPPPGPPPLEPRPVPTDPFPAELRPEFVPLSPPELRPLPPAPPEPFREAIPGDFVTVVVRVSFTWCAVALAFARSSRLFAAPPPLAQRVAPARSSVLNTPSLCRAPAASDPAPARSSGAVNASLVTPGEERSTTPSGLAFAVGSSPSGLAPAPASVTGRAGSTAAIRAAMIPVLGAGAAVGPALGAAGGSVGPAGTGGAVSAAIVPHFPLSQLVPYSLPTGGEQPFRAPREPDRATLHRE